jgi:hypothetical protein
VEASAASAGSVLLGVQERRRLAAQGRRPRQRLGMPGPSSRSSTGQHDLGPARRVAGSAFIGSAQGLRPSSAHAARSARRPRPSSGRTNAHAGAGIPASDGDPRRPGQAQQHGLGLIVERVAEQDRARAAGRPASSAAYRASRADASGPAPASATSPGRDLAPSPNDRQPRDDVRRPPRPSPAADRGRRRPRAPGSRGGPATWWAAQARRGSPRPPEQATATAARGQGVHGLHDGQRGRARAPYGPSAVHATHPAVRGPRSRRADGRSAGVVDDVEPVDAHLGRSPPGRRRRRRGTGRA